MISVERSNEGPRQLLHTEALEQGLIKGSNPSSGCECLQGLDPKAQTYQKARKEILGPTEGSSTSVLPWIESQAMPKHNDPGKYTN